MDPFANNEPVSMNSPKQTQDDGDDGPLMRSVMAMPQASDPFAFSNHSQSMSSGFGGSCSSSYNPNGSNGSKGDKLEEVGFWDSNGDTSIGAQRDPFPFTNNCSLPACPMMIQRHSTFLSHEQPRVIFQRLKEALSHLDYLDFDAKQDKFSIKGITYQPTRCIFKVNMFENKDGARVVEFQRRSGCTMSFNNVYNQVLRSLAPIVTRLYASQTNFSLQSVRCSLPPMDDINFSENFSASQQELDVALEAFVEMLENKFFECQREGVSSLALFLSSSGARLNSEMRLRLLKLLQKLLLSLSSELARGAALSINLLLASSDLPNAFGEVLPSLIQSLQTPDSLENRDTKRHASAALLVFAKDSKFNKQFSSKDFRKDLLLFSSSGDKTLSKNSSAILSILRSSC